MNHWIFQGSPDFFDVTRYIEENDDILWSVRQRHFAPEMARGDEVFLWRAAGRARSGSGVVAVARIPSNRYSHP